MIQALAKALGPLHRRVRLMVSRGILSLIDDAAGVQKVQVKLLAGEVRDGLERVQRYGFTSVPPVGSEAVVLFISGNRDHGVVIGEESRGDRLRNLKAGESALYTGEDGDGGHRIVLTQKRGIEIHGKDGVMKVKTITIEADDSVLIRTKAATIEVDTLTIKGKVSIEGDLDVSGKVAADAVATNALGKR